MNAPQQNQNQGRDDGRRSRFAFEHHSALGGFRDSSLPAALRERAASQPPREAFSAQRRFESPFGAPGTPPPSATTSSSPWSSARHASFHMNQPSSPPSVSATAGNVPARASPIRSLSFSTSSDLPSRFHPFTRDSFPSTFEDEEDEFDALTDISGLGGQDSASHLSGPGSYAQHGAHNHSSSMSGSYDYPYPIRGTRAAALAAADNASRSRSQSLAATSRRQLPIGMGSSMASHALPVPESSSMMQGWGDSPSGVPIMSSSSSGAGYFSGSRNISNDRTGDLSNVSPFVRDRNQIHDETAAFRDYWANAPFGGRDDGGASGTTSRRHSVSVVQQPRTRRSSFITGLSATGMGLGTAIEDEDISPPLHHMRAMGGGTVTSGGGRWDSGGGTRLGGGFGGAGPFAMGRFGNGTGRSMISDDELAGDLGSLSLTAEAQPRSSRGPIPHPSSLPAYALAQQGTMHQQISQSPIGTGIDRGLTPVNGDHRVQPSSPSYQTSLSRRDLTGADGEARRPSISPSRFGGRGVSREREDGLIGMGRLVADSPSAQYRQGMAQGQPAGWDVGADSQPGRAMHAQGLIPSYGGTQVGGRLPSPTLQRTSTGPTSAGGGMMQARNAYGYGPVASNVTPSTPAFGMPLSGTGGSSGGGVGLSQIRTNIGMSGPGPRSTGGMHGAPKSPLDRFQSHGSAGGGLGLSGSVSMSPTHAQPNTQGLADLGRGVPLHRIASSTPMFIVEFKATRSDIFFCNDPSLADELDMGDLVIVEADRGKDIGKIIKLGITPEEVESFQRMQIQRQSRMMGEGDDDGMRGNSPVRPFAKEIMPKRLYAKASPQDIDLLMMKGQDEAKALLLCQSKVRAKKLPMEVVEAEYQWDRRKLTFYFVSDRRIDFRELVRELFRLYKTRIWMACLQGPSSVDA